MNIIISESQFNSILSEGFRFPKVSAPKVRPFNQPVKPIVQSLNPMIRQIQLSKPTYIKQFGQQKYNELLVKLTSKQITKEQFLKELSSTKTTGAVQGVKGVVMTPEEIVKITKMSEKIANGQKPNGILKVKVGNSIEEVFINFVNLNNGNVASAGYTKNWKIVL